MSSKRRAQIQISSNPNAAFGDDRDQDDDTPIQASQQVLAARKIAVPKKRLATTGSNDNANQNPFAAAVSKNPFSGFGQAPSKVTQPQKPHQDENENENENENEYKSLLYIRALNMKFRNSINSRLEADPLMDLGHLCRQYISYSESNPHHSTAPSQPAASSFNFGNASKPDFKFASTQNPFASKPTEKEQTEQDKPSEKEQVKENDDKEEEEEEEKPKKVEIKGPSFSFKAPASFSLGQLKKDHKKEQEQDSDSEDDVEIKGPSFSLGQVPKSDKPAPFSFGVKPKETPKTDQATPTPEKPSLFKFGSGGSDHTWTPEKGIKFGQGSSPDSESSSKPAFSFGAVASSPFSAAKPPSSTGVGFSFGTSSAGAGQQEAPKPFSFGSGGGATSSTPQFSFGGTKPQDTSQAEKPQQSTGDGGDEKEITAGSVTDLSASPGPGEENETTVYEHRCKVLKLNRDKNDRPIYESAGLGTARVLKHNETNKLRILVRAEGSGRVILNVAIQHDDKVDYPIIGNNNVRILNFNQDGSLETYLIRVKTPDDAKNLKSAIDDNK